MKRCVGAGSGSGVVLVVVVPAIVGIRAVAVVVDILHRRTRRNRSHTIGIKPAGNRPAGFRAIDARKCEDVIARESGRGEEPLVLSVDRPGARRGRVEANQQGLASRNHPTGLETSANSHVVLFDRRGRCGAVGVHRKRAGECVWEPTRLSLPREYPSTPPKICPVEPSAPCAVKLPATAVNPDELFPL